MAERATNHIMLYPVDQRNQETLIPMIERHVVKGSTIYSDGWRAYQNLNKRGYKNFTVEHKHNFVQRYRDTLSGEIRTVHTNRIEGSWKFAKDHFRKINDAKISAFEAHLCEIIWRNRVVIAHHDTIISFFNLVKSHLSLRRQPNLEVRVPLFELMECHKHGQSET